MLKERRIKFFKRHCDFSATDDCIEWRGARRNGYGYCRIGGPPQSAHRAAYKLFVGEIPPNKLILHKCDNRACINPRHLFLGSQRENMQDMIKKGRHYKKNRYEPKLTQEKADLIKADNRPCTQIALDYGVSRSTISKIKNGHNWC